jgi:hypothetical protein
VQLHYFFIPHYCVLADSNAQFDAVVYAGLGARHCGRWRSYVPSEEAYGLMMIYDTFAAIVLVRAGSGARHCAGSLAQLRAESGGLWAADERIAIRLAGPARHWTRHSMAGAAAQVSCYEMLPFEQINVELAL